MDFQHSTDVWHAFPGLVPGAIAVGGITSEPNVTAAVDRFAEIARGRLAEGPESQLPEIQAWRRAFSSMGLKPTQYRCAAEALLRRFRQEGALPRIHPLIDLCNAVSIAFATPIAVFDTSRIDGGMEVRHARGDERYLTFVGEEEHPDPGEVIFADAGGRAHARRWTNRQSGFSAVRDETESVLIVAEALHASATEDVARLTSALSTEIESAWGATPRVAVLSASERRFAF